MTAEWHPSRQELKAMHRAGDHPAYKDVRDHVDAGCEFCAAVTQQIIDREESVDPPPIPGYSYARVEGFPRVGSYGTVYPAHAHGDPETLYAIKFLHEDESGPGERRAFAAEVLAALRLDHPAIVKGHDFNAVDDRLYYVMDYVNGETLGAAVEKGLFAAQADGRGWARDLAKHLRDLSLGLAHAHDRYTLHRDLHPGNVLVKRAGREVVVKICDFGLAGQLDASGRVASHGPRRYFLPFVATEQIVAGETEGPATDLYSLGAVGYLILTGQPPFRQGASLPKDIREQMPPPPSALNPAVPPALDTIILKLLRKRPSSRYGSAAELVEDLERFLSGKRLRSSPNERRDRARTALRKNRTAVAIIATISLLLVATGVLTALAWRESARADANARATRREAGDRLADSARAALSRGALAQAALDFDRAADLAGELGDAPRRRRLEVERLRALFAHDSWPRLRAELDRLAGDELAPPERAVVLLHQGDLDLWANDPDLQERGRRRVQEALATGALPPAEADFARGILADGTTAACRDLERAVGPAGEPFHLRANAALLMELTLSGQFDRARERARFMDVAFPREPVVPLARLIMALLEEDAAGRERHRAELRDLVGEARLADFDAALSYFELAVAFDRADGNPLPVKALAKAAAQPLALGRLGTSVGLGLPLLDRPRRLHAEMDRAWKLAQGGELDRAEKLLADAARRSPESFVRTMQATVHLFRGARLSGTDADGMTRESERAQRRMAEAADAPTLIPYAPYRRNAAWYVVAMNAAYRGQRWRVEAEAFTLALAPNPLLALAPLAAGRDHVKRTPHPTDDRHLIARLAAPYARPDAARDGLLPLSVNYLLEAQADVLLAAWRRDAPASPLPYRCLAALELARGEPQLARAWADRGLAVAPGDAELRRLRERADKGGRKD